ncbi:hypothetical protein NEMIN01_1254 [Nematocida minor]|uniref:uncharacterized protein n=1 Tax=Nematocida minor TaxID=1912983 RepID=UPI00221E5E98|nr:uncharacterized protein NEMIN01_1254 [Nematocida minor]KAI5190852.1 hypothetical protein NEMIN01_1254 [Nematocida minor]
MSGLTLNCVYGSSTATISAYSEETGELFVGVGRIVKKMKIRSGTSSILKLETEGNIKSISVDSGFLLALDESSKVYLYNLSYNVEVGRMHAKECKAAYAKEKRVFLDFMGYLQIWIPEDNGFFTFKKDKHITGHQDSIILMNGTKEGLITGSKDGSLREYREKENVSIKVARNKSYTVAARKIDGELYAVWASGEISKFICLEKDEWTPVHRKFTMHNLLGADISTFGDMAVVIDTSHNIMLYSTTSESKEPIKKIFVSEGITHAKFVEEDDWIVLSGNGSVVWEWKTNTLLFNEQDSSSQMVAKDIGPCIVSGTEAGDIFMWDKGSATCIQKISEHNAAIACIVPIKRGFVSLSSGGECKVHKATGEIVKQISTEMRIMKGDADEDLLVVAGPGIMKMYDLKRSKMIQEYEIDMPLAVKIVGTSVLLATMQGLTTFSPSSVSGKDGVEQFVMADISETREGVKVSCLGESGVVYAYNQEMEEIGEYRVLSAYGNGMGRSLPLGLVHTQEGELIVTYKVLRPDRIAGSRESMYAAIFHQSQEIERWKVVENMVKSSGYIFIEVGTFREAVGVCTETGVLMFTDQAGGVNPAGMWKKETPEEIEKKIVNEGDALSGAIGATQLQNAMLMRLAISTGDPVILGRYFPLEMIPQSIPVIMSAMSDGMVERSLLFLKELLKRAPGAGIIRKQLSLALSAVINLTHETTGSADALIAFPHLTQKKTE